MNSIPPAFSHEQHSLRFVQIYKYITAAQKSSAIPALCPLCPSSIHSQSRSRHILLVHLSQRDAPSSSLSSASAALPLFLLDFLTPLLPHFPFPASATSSLCRLLDPPHAVTNRSPAAPTSPPPPPRTRARAGFGTKDATSPCGSGNSARK